MEFPDNAPIAADDGTVTTPWKHWLQRVQNVVVMAYSSGATANRPTKLLWIGRGYYDTTLGKPVWVHSVTPGATPPVVWHDASGASV